MDYFKTTVRNNKFASQNRISNHSNNLVRYLKRIEECLIAVLYGCPVQIDRVLKLKKPQGTSKTIG